MNYNDPKLYPFIEVLESHFETFAKEALQLRSDDFLPMPDENENYEAGKWAACPLFLHQYGEDFPQLILEQNQARCPETTRILRQIDNLVVGGFMVLRPDGRVREHHDHRDDNVIRVHVAIQLPEHERAYWEEGRARLMDIRMAHEAHNPSSRDRLTLCCDVRMDFDIPDDVITPWGTPTSTE